ncbi:Protein DSF2 [Hypsizygus marmoreus]|uniref:Protein DSF2 n=1 Tax=Hypsizygus marmoreus TaxID=39966 RepID=A0A369K4Q8_HYPMA|nr:Protein DSF2 [Hypsizygus marmoreus]
MAAPASAFKFHSPLDSLVRRTSARKPEPSTNNLSLDPHRTPPRQQQLHPQRSPASPLLHSHFARDSVATASSTDNNSYLDSSRTSVDSRTVYHDPELEYRYYDDESIYSNNTGPALRDSWQSAGTSDTLRGGANTSHFNLGTTPSQTHFNEAPRPPSPPSPSSPVPTVIVSSPTDPSEISAYPTRGGRAPIVKPITDNFSRPVRPLITPEAEEQKRRVLERNARRGTSPSTSHREPSRTSYEQEIRHSQSTPYLKGGGVAALTSDISSMEMSSNMSMRSRPDTRRSPSPHRGPSPASTAFSQAPNMMLNRNLNPSTLPLSSGPPNPHPSARVGSPVSLYSNYSYYQLDSATPSPTSGNFTDAPLDPSAFTTKPRIAPSPPTPTPASQTPGAGTSVTSDLKTPQDYLQLGIQHHEANRLEESAICFEKSAKENGGCGVGMLMWGLALRHGWGCEKNEKLGFKWLRRAAESAVEDLENARAGGGVDSVAVQTELILAIYEVGQCFFQGWGVPKDQKMAVSYYTVAARLGDADAQNDLAFCLANGKGCKKDRKEAAKWYRAAVAQGQSDIGLAWIYKEKYQ